jgi:hypothetical protein
VAKVLPPFPFIGASLALFPVVSTDNERLLGGRQRNLDDDLRAFLERLKRTADALEANLRESSRLGRWRSERKAA